MPSHDIADRTNRDGVYLEVQKIIRSTGKFADDLTARYFRRFHPFTPIVSRSRFHSSLVATGKPPAADTSILLLSICLLAYVPNLDLHLSDGETPVIGGQSLYLATKALLAQVQGSLQPSVHLIQACLLLVMYEYANGRPDVALITIASCARMAYAAGIHESSHRDMNCGLQLTEAKEARNTWWGIVMYERSVFLFSLASYP